MIPLHSLKSYIKRHTPGENLLQTHVWRDRTQHNALISTGQTVLDLNSYSPTSASKCSQVQNGGERGSQSFQKSQSASDRHTGSPQQMLAFFSLWIRRPSHFILCSPRGGLHFLPWGFNEDKHEENIRARDGEGKTKELEWPALLPPGERASVPSPREHGVSMSPCPQGGTFNAWVKVTALRQPRSKDKERTDIRIHSNTKS